MKPKISNLGIRKDIEGLMPHTVSLHWPSKTDCPDCGFDEFTQSGEDVACTTCNGTGKVTTWYPSHAKCRIKWIDLAQPMWGQMASGPVGDVWLQMPYRFKSLAEKIKDTDGAYITVDSKTVKPISVDVNRVEGITTTDVRCEVVNV